MPGGKGANQAVAAARLGAQVRFVGGSAATTSCCESLERGRRGHQRVVRDDGETGVALILVDAEGENVIVVAPGANRRLKPEDVEVGEADAVICQLEIPLEVVQAAPRPRRGSSA